MEVVCGTSLCGLIFIKPTTHSRTVLYQQQDCTETSETSHPDMEGVIRCRIFFM